MKIECAAYSSDFQFERKDYSPLKFIIYVAWQFAEPAFKPDGWC